MPNMEINITNIFYGITMHDKGSKADLSLQVQSSAAGLQFLTPEYKKII